MTDLEQELCEAAAPGDLESQARVAKNIKEYPVTEKRMLEVINRFHWQTIEAIRDAAITSPDLKSQQHSKDNPHPLAGHCYIVCEAICHILKGYKPMVVKHDGVSHWFLKDRNGNIVDPTKEQFKNSVDYAAGRGNGFLTKEPSNRAKELIRRALPWTRKEKDDV